MDVEEERTRDTVEQLEERDLPNPITDEDADLGEAGDAIRPEGEAGDKDDAEGPVPHTTQMPR